MTTLNQLSTVKLLLIVILGGVALLLGSGIVITQIRINHYNNSHNQQRSDGSTSAASPRSLSGTQTEEWRRKRASLAQARTIAPSIPTDADDLFLWKRSSQHTHRATGEAYWHQVQTFLARHGDALAQAAQKEDEEGDGEVDAPEDDEGKQRKQEGWSRLFGALGGVGGEKETITADSAEEDDTTEPPLSHIHTSLLQAAEWGHGDAQHYVAVALNSGIWFTQDHNSTLSSPSQINQDFHSFSNDESVIRWHMAALDGNLEALASLGHRYLHHEQRCDAALPFLESAAHIILDTLESDPHSRAKILPPMDRHMLAEIHVHGVTSSTLQWDNKPNESPEAIQYYHLLSTKQPDPDVLAAYTLGHMYHYGLRGIPQNLTMAYGYYEIAANANHWEAAGQAGKFHLWSLGRHWKERNLQTAHKFFQKGAPFSIQECRRRFQEALRAKKKDQTIDDTAVTVCDHPSLNGLGLLHLYGIPMMIAKDPFKAKGFFELARDMENIDASYNLAMMKLGHLTAWKDNVNVRAGSGEREAGEKEEEKGDGDGGKREKDEEHKDGDDTAVSIQKPSQPPKKTSPSKEDVLTALRELTTAANRGHIQARHRLAMLYSEGRKSPSTGDVIIAKDCKKAATNYQWIIRQASPALSKRTRLAYQQYMDGDLDKALMNYILAAETGHLLSQVNAAFLFERGVCLTLTKLQCRQASLRYWKAAAQAGHAEAALRVGDFYYYGSQQKTTLLDAVLFPEVHMMPWLQKKFALLRELYGHWIGLGPAGAPMTEPIAEGGDGDASDTDEAEPGSCSSGGTEQGGTCQNPDPSSSSDDIVVADSDSDGSDVELEKAAQYYRMAAQEHKSARANYNLGYMHEWGLGLAQDFPLAKRHYDLAGESSQATLAVHLALLTMDIHERYLKWRSWWNGLEWTVFGK